MPIRHIAVKAPLTERLPACTAGNLPILSLLPALFLRSRIRDIAYTESEVIDESPLRAILRPYLARLIRAFMTFLICSR